MNGTPQSLARLEERRIGGSTIALITIDNPPVNAASRQMRADLLHAVELASHTGGLAGVILIGANGNFVAGSDIREFDTPPAPPHLPEVIAAIEACPVPVVAAIDGTALGGGFELALGCDARLATPRAIVGLPEVTLGLIPGAGGTFRLPRLVGSAEAIRLVTSGRRVGAEEARRLGMVDAIADGDLIEAALAHLAGLAGQKRRLRDLPPIVSPPEEVAAAEAAARRKAAGSDAVDAAIAAIHAGLHRPAAEALAVERATSLHLRVGAQSRALRHLFFAERAALKRPAGMVPSPVATVGIVGAGQMGRGIALAFAMAGYRVRLAEAGEAQLAAGRAALEKTIGQLAAKGRIQSPETLTARISGGPLEAMAECDLVIEAIIEDMAAKVSLFAALDKLCPPATILASNTSYLDINALAAATGRPSRVAGFHFFNPAHLMRLVEIIRTDAIAPETEATLLAVSKTLGKVPVVAARVAEGFIGNRIFSAYRRQAEFLVEEGALPEDVDRTMRAFGMAMGPFAVFDLAGLDIAWATRQRLAPTRDPRQRYVTIADRLCEAGRFGRKTGRGWYDYASSPAGAPDPEVRRLIEQGAAETGTVRRQIAAAEIEGRLLAAIVNEAALVLDEKIARRASDIDLVFVHGYGFPAIKGGPLYWAASQPREMFRASVTMMADKGGVGIEPAENLDAVLDDAGASQQLR